MSPIITGEVRVEDYGSCRNNMRESRGSHPVEPKECPMHPVIAINRLVIKPGKIDEFISAQRKFAESLPPCGLVGGRMYRSVDGRGTVLLSVFESQTAAEEVLRSADLKAHVKTLQPLVETSSPALYEVAYTYGDFK